MFLLQSLFSSKLIVCRGSQPPARFRICDEVEFQEEVDKKSGAPHKAVAIHYLKSPPVVQDAGFIISLKENVGTIYAVQHPDDLPFRVHDVDS